MYSSTRRYPIKESPVIVVTRILILLFVAISLILFIVGFFLKNSSILFLIIPIGILSSLSIFLYQISKGFYTKRNRQRLVEVINNAAGFLENNPPQLTMFDITLSSKMDFVWEGVISPFLISTARFLNHARYVIIAEDHGRSKVWSSDPTLSPLVQVASITRKMAVSLSEDDPIKTYEAIGELFALYLQNRRELEKKPEINYLNEQFREDLSKISASLKNNNLLGADQHQERLIEHLKQYKSSIDSIYTWQAFIAYWVWLRLSLIDSPNITFYIPGWSDPYSLLSRQIDAITRSFKDEDWMGISEIVYGSFDWRTWILQILV